MIGLGKKICNATDIDVGFTHGKEIGEVRVPHVNDSIVVRKG